jgi:lipoyl(octanoyl) transferase
MHTLIVKHLGRCDYESVWRRMQGFTRARTGDTPDQLWLLDHSPVFTFGLNGKPGHLLDAGGIPVVHCDRGGQVTYHGPGQLVAYGLIDLRRLGLGVKDYVTRLEQAAIDVLADYGIDAERRADAPGVYVAGAKIAALGLRVTRGAAYHGLSLNVAMDLAPFSRINPCGFPALAVTQMRALVETPVEMRQVGDKLAAAFARQLGLAISGGEDVTV